MKEMLWKGFLAEKQGNVKKITPLLQNRSRGVSIKYQQ
jgi:hypothetical protein